LEEAERSEAGGLEGGRGPTDTPMLGSLRGPGAKGQSRRRPPRLRGTPLVQNNASGPDRLGPKTDPTAPRTFRELDNRRSNR